MRSLRSGIGPVPRSRRVRAGAAVLTPAFRKSLLAWYEVSKRDLPWRKSTDFYPVWLSEIMLQQTRVETVIPYFERFLARFPSVQDLAAAPETDVLALWSGLGYYSRARNMHRAARQIADSGTPRSYADIAALPGAGPYTAAAIASIALGLPHAAVDGNVIRVISRLTNDGSESTSPAARRRFTEVAGQLLARRRPGDFNQAMMELGATICTPRNPRCGDCPVHNFCEARAAGTAAELPVKVKKNAAREVTLDLLLLENDGRIFLVSRGASEKRMAGFLELPEKRLFPRVKGAKRNQFTHQIVNDRFRVTVWTTRAQVPLPPGQWLDLSEIGNVPLTTISRKALTARREPVTISST